LEGAPIVLATIKLKAPMPEAGRTGAQELAEDGQLLARMAKRDAEAFRALINRHLALVVAIARRMLGDPAEADDVAQDTFLRLWNAGGGIEVGQGGLKPWLRRVVSNLCIDRIRARRNIQLVDEVPERAEAAKQLEGIETRELSMRVQSALQTLPDRQRQALVLFHFEGLSLNEVAAALTVSAEAVESLLARARRSLKASLAGDWRDLLPETSET